MTKFQTRYTDGSSLVPPTLRQAEPARQPPPTDAGPPGTAPLPDALPDALPDGAGVAQRIAACRLCLPRFAATPTAHEPRPVVWFRPGARLLIASQAPGMRAHLGGRPFMDASGVRLREWMGIGEDDFYDRSRVAIVPVGFCFPGYDAKGADIPPPAICAATWRHEALSVLPGLQLTILVGGMAQAWHLGKGGVTERVRAWRDLAPGTFALPHPSWRNTAWLKANPWFAEEVLPALRARVAEVLAPKVLAPKVLAPEVLADG